MSKLKYVWKNLEFILAGLCLMFMAIALFLQVVMRFVFNNPIGWTEELAVMLFVMMVYIGSIGATRRDEHLRLEVVVNMFGPKGQLVMRIISNILFIVVNCFIIYGITGVTMNLQRYGMKTAMLGIPKWIPYAVLPVCFVLISVRLIQECIVKGKEIKELDNKKSAGEEQTAGSAE